MDKKKITDYIQKHHMIQPGDCVIAAVSGGADSVAMLLMLSELSAEMNFLLVAVHVEHGIRGEESLADMRFTKELCEKMGIPIRIYRVKARTYARKNGLGLEEAARELRYKMLDTAAETVRDLLEKYDQMKKQDGENALLPMENEIPSFGIKIALAHHMQDQAETVLFRLARGTGLHGLSGMQPVRQSRRSHTYIRPLLNTSRSEIEAYLAARGQEYRVDSTNLDESYARNRIRSRVLPELSEVNAQAAIHIAQAAEQAAEISDFIAGEAARELRRIATVEESQELRRINTVEVEAPFERIGRLSLKIPELLELHPALQKELLRQALTRIAGHEKDITAGHILQLLELTEKTSGKEISLPYEVRAAREFDQLVLSKKTADWQTGQLKIGADQLEELKKAGEELKLPLGTAEEAVLKICRTTEPERTDPNGGNLHPDCCGDRKYFAYEKLKDGFTIRHRQPGDFFSMKDGHHKKLKQYLIDEKIPVSERPKLWLLAQDSQVVWLFGRREDTAYRPDKDTEDILSIEYRVRNAAEID